MLLAPAFFLLVLWLTFTPGAVWVLRSPDGTGPAETCRRVFMVFAASFPVLRPSEGRRSALRVR